LDSFTFGRGALDLERRVEWPAADLPFFLAIDGLKEETGEPNGGKTMSRPYCVNGPAA